MKIAKAHKKLILNLREPERVVGVIPSAKMVKYKGRNLVAVPHRLDEVRVLRNLGMNAPAPISSYYAWSGPYDPFIHQRVTAEELTLNPRMFCLNGMGSGKTLSVLWAFDWLRSIGVVRSMLVVAPLSTLERVWADEVYTHFPHLTTKVLHGARAKRNAALAVPADIYIINHDGIKDDDTLKAIRDQKLIDVVAIDEVASFRNHRTEKWQYLNRIVNGYPKMNMQPKLWAWGLTGTPTPTDAADAYGQVKLINPSLVPESYTRFRDRVTYQIGMRWVNRANALDTVYKVMQPAVRFSTQDCIDLPPTTYTVRSVPLSPEQKKAYDEMLKQYQIEFDAGEITAANEAVKINKLLQVCSGAVYDNDKNVVPIPAPARLAELKALIDQSESKTIVFVPYTAPLHIVAAELRKTYTVEVVDGSVPKGERDRIFHAFQNTPDPKVLVANASTMAHGLTLTAASLIVWYGLPHSLEIYEQANARIPRPGQKLHTVIAAITSSPIESRVQEKLRTRSRVQGTLLDMFK